MVGEPINEAAAMQMAQQHGIEWQYSHTTESTNVDVLHHYGQHQAEIIAVSEAQSAGRGRRGRQWHSPFARNIYCSIGLIKALPANIQGLLSIVTGIALCRSLQHSSAAAVKLKWPNDILFDGDKLGGILIESRPHDDSRFFFVIGFGLNVFMPDEDLETIGQPVTSLDKISAHPLDRTEVLTTAIDAVVRSIRGFDPADARNISLEFEGFDAFHGREVEVVSGQERISGLNRGITSSGQLQLETDQGLQLHSAAEISLRVFPE